MASSAYRFVLFLRQSCKCKITILETKLIFEMPLATEKNREEKCWNQWCTVIIWSGRCCFSLRVGRVKIRHWEKKQMSPPPPQEKEKNQGYSNSFQTAMRWTRSDLHLELPSLKLTFSPLKLGPTKRKLHLPIINSLAIHRGGIKNPPIDFRPLKKGPSSVHLSPPQKKKTKKTLKNVRKNGGWCDLDDDGVFPVPEICSLIGRGNEGGHWLFRFFFWGGHEKTYPLLGWKSSSIRIPANFDMAHLCLNHSGVTRCAGRRNLCNRWQSFCCSASCQ